MAQYRVRSAGKDERSHPLALPGQLWAADRVDAAVEDDVAGSDRSGAGSNRG